MAGFRRRSRRALAWALLFALLSVAAPAGAHAVGLSRGEYSLTGRRLTARLTFARADVVGLGGDALLRGVAVTAAGAPCVGEDDGFEPVPPDATAWRAHFACPSGPVTIRLPLFEELPDGHRHDALVRVDGRIVEDVLYRRHDSLTFEMGEAGQETGPARDAARTRGMIRMGVEHILTGYDHLAFLLALVLAGARWRSVLAAVTAFTVSHSITLAVAALGAWTPPARFVEPAIALSIAYVGLENLSRKEVERRWRVTLAFGLIHGFGFASALRDLSLPPADVPLALLSFNAGVECGQLAVLAVVLPALGLLGRWPRFAAGGARALSGATAALGAVWFVARVL